MIRNLEVINSEISIFSSCEEAMDNWRPSVYKVFICLFRYENSIYWNIAYTNFSICGILISFSGFVYSKVEGWPFIDALYFCFIRFFFQVNLKLKRVFLASQPLDLAIMFRIRKKSRLSMRIFIGIFLHLFGR